MYFVVVYLAFLFASSFAAVCTPSTTWTGCDPTGTVTSWGLNNKVQTFTAPYDTTITSITVYVHSATDYTKRDIHLDLALNDVTSSTYLESQVLWDQTPGAVTFPFDMDVAGGDTIWWMFNGADSNAMIGIATGQTDCAGSAAYYLWSVEFTCPSSSSGDPHFFGFQGQKYDVMGQSFEIYNIITAPYLQINSRFTPYYKTAAQVEPTGTMMGELGIKVNSHKFLINSNSTVALLDGQDMKMTSDWSLEIGTVTISNVVKGKMYEVTVETPDLAITFVRKVYKVSGSDPQWHFDYLAKMKEVNSDLHGLLGQTWELKDFANKEGAFKFLDGAEDDYRLMSNNILGDDFKYNKFQNL